MRPSWERYARLLQRRAIAVLMAAVVLTGALGVGLTRLAFKSTNDTLVDTSSRVYRDDLRYERAFGGEVMLVVYEGNVRALLSDPPARSALSGLASALARLDGVHAVISPLDAVAYEQAELPIAARLATPAMVARSAADGARLLAAGPQTLDNPRFVDFLLHGADGRIRSSLVGVFPDARHALLAVRLSGDVPASAMSQTASEITRLALVHPVPGFTATVTGSAALLKEVNDGMRSGIATTGAIAIVVMGLVLLALFRARWRLVVLPVVLLGIVWTFALLGLIGVPMTMVTISGLPILIGLGVDFGIQFHSRYHEERGSLVRAMRGIGPALVIALIAAIAGFGALQLSRVPMIRQFGLTLAIGTSLLVVCVLGVLPAALTVLDQHAGPAPAARREGVVERAVRGLTGLGLRPLAVLAVAAVLVTAGAVALRRTPVETDPEKYVPQHGAVVRGLQHLRDIGAATGDIGFLIEGDVMRPDVLAWMAGYEREELAKHPADLLLSTSVASTAYQTTGSTSPAAVSAVIAPAPAGIRRAMVADDGRTYQIDFAVGHLTLGHQKQLLAEMEADLHAPPGIVAVPAGLSVIGIATVDAMRTGQSMMALAGVFAVLAWLLLRFRRVRRALLAVVPVVTAIGLSSLIVYLLGVQVSALGALSTPIVVAIGTEFSVLVLERFDEERRAGRDPDEALRVASTRIGRAFVTSGVTTAGGFAVLAFSGFPLLASFGTLVALNVLITMACVLVVLPPLLVWGDVAWVAWPNARSPSARTVPLRTSRSIGPSGATPSPST